MVRKTNYDQVSKTYDDAEIRTRREPDQVLIDFISRSSRRWDKKDSLTVLDIGCGTGNQLVADNEFLREHYNIAFYGLDYSIGMLKKAEGKSREISWVQGTGDSLPFKSNSFDYIKNQFAFHHIDNKEKTIEEVYRVLRSPGVFLMNNISPRDMVGWWVYDYFPSAYEADMERFMATDDIISLLKVCGFRRIELKERWWKEENPFSEAYELAKNRYTCSQLTSISDRDYENGVSNLKEEVLRESGKNLRIHSENCLVEIVGWK